MANPPVQLTITDALRLAAHHHAAGRLAEAGILVDAVLAARPDLPEAQYARAALDHAGGRFVATMVRCRRALALRPEFADAADALGVALATAGRLDEAATAHRHALRLVPEVARAHANQAGVLARLGRIAAADRAARTAVALDPAAAVALYNLAKTRDAAGDVRMAEAAYRRTLVVDPGFAAAAANLGNRLWKTGQPEQALGWTDRALAANPSDVGALNVKVMALADLGRTEEARAAGTQLLDVKDRQAMARFAVLFPPPGLAAGGAIGAGSRRDGIDVIAFSLWGDRPLYTEGALANLEIAAALYPGWRCRFYVDASVPETVVRSLRDKGGDVVWVDESRERIHGAFWRFYAADDPTVRRFLCRDCDARVNAQEQAAVAEWLASGMPFHIMRDHLYHAELILAGMWGGTAGWLPPLKPLIDRTHRGHSDRWGDQDFLATVVWPMIKTHCRIHDSHYRLFGATDFPPHPRLVRPDHVGNAVPID